MCLCLSNSPTATSIFLDEARNAEAASLLDSTADMKGHGDTHRFTPDINRPPKGTDNNGTALSTRQRRHSPPLPLEKERPPRRGAVKCDRDNSPYGLRFEAQRPRRNSPAAVSHRHYKYYLPKSNKSANCLYSARSNKSIVLLVARRIVSLHVLSLCNIGKITFRP